MKNKYTLRVVSGSFRGKGIISPVDFSVRPTSQRVKESFFNIVRTKLYGSNFLDVFCGTGQIGIEAASNGAKVTFVDANTQLVRKNLSAISFNDALVLQGEFKNVLSQLKNKGIKFDFIYADPPYREGLYEDIIEYALPLIKEDGCLILEHATDIKFDCDQALVTDVRAYGSRTLTFVGGTK